MTGLEMLEALKGDATLRDIPVVIMSPTEADAIPAGMRSHLRGFVQKPFTVEELMAVIEPILRPPAR